MRLGRSRRNLHSSVACPRWSNISAAPDARFTSATVRPAPTLKNTRNPRASTMAAAAAAAAACSFSVAAAEQFDADGAEPAADARRRAGRAWGCWQGQGGWPVWRWPAAHRRSTAARPDVGVAAARKQQGLCPGCKPPHFRQW